MAEGGTSDISEGINTLSAAMQEAGKVMYEQAAAQEQAAHVDPGQESAEDDDDVIDADFTECAS